MKRIYVTCLLLGLILAASGVSAQVFFTVYPDPVPLEQSVVLRIENRMRSTIQLPSSAPWTIHDSLGGLVYAPMSLPVTVPVKPLASVQWTWGQKDFKQQQVKAGSYEARINYWLGSQNYPLKTPFQIDQVTLGISGNATPGGRVHLDIHASTSTGMPYQLACSLGDMPGIALPVTRLLRLNPDPLFFLSILFPGTTFQNFTGITSKSGYGTGFVNIPGDKRLIGVTFFAAYVTLHAAAPGGIHVYSTSKAVLIQ